MKLHRYCLVLALVTPAAWADGDAARGAQLYNSRCIACHSPDANRVGPAHRGVYGRKAGGVADFSYSSALRGAKLTWTDKTLDKWLTDPESLLPGQTMGYQVPDATDRSDLIAYLKQISQK